MSVLEASDNGIYNRCLVEAELLRDVLQEAERGLPDLSPIVNNVLEGAKIDGDDQLLLDWGLLQSDVHQLLKLFVEENLQILIENNLSKTL